MVICSAVWLRVPGGLSGSAITWWLGDYDGFRIDFAALRIRNCRGRITGTEFVSCTLGGVRPPIAATGGQRLTCRRLNEADAPVETVSDR